MSKTKRRALAASALGAVVVAVLFSWRLLHSPPTPIDIAQELQQIVSDTVAKDPSVKNCVLSVMKGDGSHDWHELQFPLQYGYGTMYFKFPRTMAAMTSLPPLWGHSGSTGSFLYRSEDLDLYLAGTIDQTQSKVKPFLLMRQVMRAIESRQRAQVGLSGHTGAAGSR